ncbi:penicillin-binding protein, partial [Candidatus Nomurabacteria bacterium]|nr:penicillin-binding protein [Candidatus Nomurabacteria bacterium]
MRKLSNKKIVLLMCAGIFVFLGALLVWASLFKLPDLSNFSARKIANSSKIVDRTGEVVLYDINQGVRRTEIPLSEMGDNIKNASISIEDENFYSHNGIRPTSIIRAVWVNLTSRSLSQGGSTITQQIIKNTLLNTDKKFTRKVKEWVLALKLEKYFTKDQILEIYLNDNPYGGTIYGVEEASQAFFSKSSKDLTIAEAAYLAAIPQAPTYYSPFGKNKDKLESRKNTVLKKMNSLKYISDEQYDQAKNEIVVFNTQAQNSIKAPHFVFYILDYLQEKYGKDV